MPLRELQPTHRWVGFESTPAPFCFRGGCVLGSSRQVEPLACPLYTRRSRTGRPARWRLLGGSTLIQELAVEVDDLLRGPGRHRGQGKVVRWSWLRRCVAPAQLLNRQPGRLRHPARGPDNVQRSQHLRVPLPLQGPTSLNGSVDVPEPLRGIGDGCVDHLNASVFATVTDAVDPSGASTHPFTLPLTRA